MFIYHIYSLLPSFLIESDYFSCESAFIHRNFHSSMLSPNRVGTTRQFLRSISLKPDFSKYKLKQAPPGNIVGTVNDAYVPPVSNYYEGGHHWSYERLVSGAMIPLTIAPFIFGTDIPMLDATWAVTALLHCQMGLKSCIIDYIPKRVYGIWYKYATRLLNFGTAVGIYGIYVIETTQSGVFNLLASIWGA